MGPKKKFPAARNTFNHLGHFEESAVDVIRVKEVAGQDAVSEVQRVLPEIVREDILKAAEALFKDNKVYGKDDRTKLLLSNFMTGLEAYLKDSEHVLQGDLF